MIIDGFYDETDFKVRKKITEDLIVSITKDDFLDIATEDDSLGVSMPLEAFADIVNFVKENTPCR